MVFVLFLIAVGCRKDELLTPEYKTSELVLYSGGVNEGEIELGSRLTNPYTIALFRDAFDTLGLSTIAGITSDQLQPSHSYFKIIPADSSEFYTLWADSTIELFSYPLDYEITKGGTYYFDDNSTTDVTPQYTALEQSRLSDLSAYTYSSLASLFLKDNS
jgi:hypothetical protein